MPFSKQKPPVLRPAKMPEPKGGKSQSTSRRLPNVAKELNKMIGAFRNKKSDRRLIALAVIITVFLASATPAALLNHEGNTRAWVAESARQINRQEDDTQAAFKDIKELIPEAQSPEAVSPDSYANGPASGVDRSFNSARPRLLATCPCRKTAAETTVSTPDQTPATG